MPTNYPVGTHMSGPLKLGTNSMLLSTDVGGIAAAKTLTADESNGQTYVLDGGTGVNVTLPAATKGWKTKFIVGAVFGTDFTFTAETAGTMNGTVMEAGVLQLIGAADDIDLEDGVEVIGDFLEFSSDGTSIFVFGSTSVDNSVTPA